MSAPRRILNLVLGFACFAASIALYLIYSEIVVSIWPGIASVAAFSLGVYVLRQEFYRWRLLKPFARILPFIIVGAFVSIIIVGFGIQNQVAGSYYASALSFVSSRFAKSRPAIKAAISLPLGAFRPTSATITMERRPKRIEEYAPLHNGPTESARPLGK